MQKTILIVDDEQMVVDITRRKLEREGYLVLGVYDGEQALKVLRDALVDLIILDVEMPVMNGYVFLSERKKIMGADEIPVIMLTAYGFMEPIFRRNGVADYLTKPLRFDDLIAKIRSVLAFTDAKKQS
jgi:DNA-binding response OmpR family regulator